MKTYALATALAVRRLRADRTRGRRDRARGSPRGALASLAVQTRALVVGAALAFAWESLRTGAACSATRRLRGRARADPPRSSRSTRAASCSATSASTACAARAGSSATSSRKARSSPTCSGSRRTRRPRHAVPAARRSRRSSPRSSRAASADELPLWFLVARAARARPRCFPTPTYTQYFATTVPFLIVGVVELARRARTRPGDARRCCARPLAAVWLARVPRVRAGRARPTIVRASARGPSVPRAGGRRLRSTRAPTPGEAGARVVAGYLFGTHARPVARARERLRAARRRAARRPTRRSATT